MKERALTVYAEVRFLGAHMNTPDTKALTLPIGSVIVADRYRTDLGDLDDLKKSISNVGLLNPITVREWHGGYRLVAGERRLTAFKAMGLTEIPARVVADIADARDALVAERDENTARKPMLPSEATLLGMAIEDMERPAASARRTANLPNGSRDPFGGEGGRARDIAAEAVGISEPSYRRIKTLIGTARDEGQPQEVRAAAQEAVAAIDEGGPVRNAYDKVKDVQREVADRPASAKRTNEPTEYLTALATLHPTVRIAFERDAHDRYKNVASLANAAQRAGVKWTWTEKQWQVRVSRSADVLNRSSQSIGVALSAVDDVVDLSTITPEQAEQALERLDSASLNRLIKKLKEIAHG